MYDSGDSGLSYLFVQPFHDGLVWHGASRSHLALWRLDGLEIQHVCVRSQNDDMLIVSKLEGGKREHAVKEVVWREFVS